MKTTYWTWADVSSRETVITEASQRLREGELVAFPTETVYGLGADATNADAVSRIFEAKQRPQDNPLIAHVATVEQLLALVTDLPPYAEQLIEAFTPGPITFVLPSNGTCAENVTAGLTSIAVRIPDHPVAQALLAAVDLPIAAPSANLSGKPSPTTADHVWHDLSGRIAGVLDGGPTGIGMESTVVNCLDPSGPVILRPGGITAEQIEAVVGPLSNQVNETLEVETPQSPGMKYKHYAPDMPLKIIEGSVTTLQQEITDAQKRGKRVGVMARDHIAEALTADEIIPLGQDLSDVAAHLYDALRAFNSEEIDLIISEAYQSEGIGEAIMNRLEKAASEV